MKPKSSPIPFQYRSVFRFAGPVNRWDYFQVGISLMLIKYLVEAATIYVTTGLRYTPIDFMNPLLSSREFFFNASSPWLGMAWILWSLPFFWIAVAMSIRRASDIGVSPWFGLVILVPIVNWLGMLLMSLIPSQIQGSQHGADSEPEKSDTERLIEAFRALEPNSFPTNELNASEVGASRTRTTEFAELADFVKVPYDGVTAAILGIGGGTLYAISMVLFSVYVLSSYGAAMFFGTPVVTGAIAAYLYNRGIAKSVGQTLGQGSLTIAFACTGLLCFGIEGAICIAMAIPIMLPLGLFGALIGRAIAVATTNPHRDEWTGMAGCLMVLPLIAIVEPRWQTTPTFDVMTSVEIQAKPEEVWKQVVEFPDITSEREWFFALGIASPQRAHIVGQGVGAVRHCEFTTGTFVEPITVWNPPFQLAFDVSEQPDPMVELTPYRHLHPPHLGHSFRSTRGEFRLIDIGNNRTRLEGRTWYKLEIYPLSYWTLWTDWIVHRIHLRVLNHIQKMAESTRSDR